MLRGVDSSLLDEWEKMRDPDYRPLGTGGVDLRPPRPELPPDVTRDTKAFTAAIRNTPLRIPARVVDRERRGRAGSLGGDASRPERSTPRKAPLRAWSAARLKVAREAHRVEHAGPRLDPEARNLRHTHVEPSPDGASWRVQQMLVDPEGLNDWALELDVDLAASRQRGEPVLKLVRLASLI